MAKTIFLTGATGLVGSYLAREFVRRGYHLRLLTRPTSDRSVLADLPDSSLTWVEGDLSDIWLLREAMQNVDFVVHAAAKVSFWKREADELHCINVEGTENMVNAALELGTVKKFVQIGSIATIGRPPKGKVELDETAKWSSEDAVHDYAETKHLAELEVWRGVAEGLQAISVNPSLVLGKGDWSRSSLQIFDYIDRKNQYHPQGTVNYVDVRDVAEMTADLLESKINNERFILSAGAMPYGDLFGRIAEQMNKESRSKELPKWLGGIVWRWEAFRSFLTQTPPKVTKQTLKSARQPHVYQNNKVKNALARDFRSLDETLNWALG
ncbi:MAG: NAD-dependent epimerase/dehydratase family protein [Bacteroidota bacterium]